MNPNVCNQKQYIICNKNGGENFEKANLLIQSRKNKYKFMNSNLL